jgi:hypothetical protein
MRIFSIDINPLRGIAANRGAGNTRFSIDIVPLRGIAANRLCRTPFRFPVGGIISTERSEHMNTFNKKAQGE